MPAPDVEEGNDMADITGTAWINGEFVAARDATISIFDSGFIGGVAVFDTLACWKGRLFKLDAHLRRFARSAHAAAIPLPLAGSALAEVVVETVRRSELRDAYVQVIATRGVRASPASWDAPSTLIVYAIPYVWIGGEDKVDAGLKVVIPSVRNTPSTSLDPRIKNFNRFHSYLAKLESDRAGADEVVMLDGQGYLTEGRGANVFLVAGGSLYTPAQGILQGITRETVFEIAAELGIPARERDLTPYDLYTADEAFFSTTAGGIIPLVEADGRRIGDGLPGPLTRRIHDRYWERHESGPDTTRVY
jgi:branched-chain amino acid aminotransferase